jgi:hypothetical protein
VREAFLLGRIFWLQPDQAEERRRRKKAFITPYGAFCYQVMPFGLKNAGATYQWMMQNCLGSQIGRNIQVYINDVVITTRKEESLISDLMETFDNLNRYKLKLNATKCSFGVSAGQLLGFLVSARGIEANPEKIQAILTMVKPAKLHDVQKLAGRVATLSRFVALMKSQRTSSPFLHTHEKSDDKFEWTEEADTAFAQLKNCSPHHQCWSHQKKKSHYYYIS